MQSHSHMHAVQKSLGKLKLSVKQRNRQKAQLQEAVLLKFSRGHKKTLQASICSHTGHLLHFQRMSNLKSLQSLALYTNITSLIENVLYI